MRTARLVLARDVRRCVAGFVLAALAVGSAATVAATSPAIDEASVMASLGGASAGGFHALLGETIAEMVRRAYPGSSIGYEPGSQAGQLVRTVRGEISLSLQTAIELQLALQGYPVFPRAYDARELPVIAKIIDRQDIVLFVTEEAAERHGIASLADIRDKRPPLRMSFYPRGNLFARGLVFETVLAAYGITEQAVTDWGGRAYYVASAETQRLVVDHKVDLWLSASFHPDAKTLEIARAVALRALAVDREVIDRAADRFGLKTGYLPAGTYDFLPEDYYTPAVPTYLVASPRMSDEEAYKLARSLYTQFDHYRGAHPNFAKLSPAILAEHDQFKLHPGAERWYREVGLIGKAQE